MPVKAGGEKGRKIVETIKADRNKKMTRKAIAESVGCTVGRVGETVRYLAAEGSPAEKKMVAHLVSKREAAPAPAEEAKDE